MSDGEPSVKNGWRFPPGVKVPDDSDWYRISFGSNTARGWSWAAHVDQLHEFHEDVSIETEVVDSGFSPESRGKSVQYAAVKATVEVDGARFSSLQAADETTQQVRDPEFVFAVAESRALKRAIKKALNIKPATKETTKAVDEEAGTDYDDYGHPKGGRSPSGPEPEPPAADESEDGSEDEPDPSTGEPRTPEPDVDEDLDW